MTFSAGDRVYSVTHPELTGTVHAIEEGAGRCAVVVWDDGTVQVWNVSDLECWTRPAAKIVSQIA